MEEQIDLFDPVDITRVRRRQLLPWWIKVFCWVFIIFGLAVLVCVVLGLLGYSADLALYGLETDQPLSWIGLLIIAIGIFKGITAFALWFEKDYAISLGKLDAITGIAICTINMALPNFIDNFHATIRLELVLLIPFLLRLNKIRHEWTRQ